MSNCCIIIPLYRNYNSLSAFEKKFLNNTLDVLSKYDIYIIGPTYINENQYKQFNIKDFIKFNNYYFRDIYGYNDLCLSCNFYKTFDKYDYMLISQLDAWVFSDKLEEFVNMDYDYIGCLHTTSIIPDHLTNGNGGFSLRKIKTFEIASKNIRRELNMTNMSEWEDIMYSYYYKDKLNIAPYDVSLQFGWQQMPEKNYIENGKRLPFGAHKPHIFGKDFNIYKEAIKW